MSSSCSPKPKTRNPKPDTVNSNPEPRNFNPETLTQVLIVDGCDVHVKDSWPSTLLTTNKLFEDFSRASAEASQSLVLILEVLGAPTTLSAGGPRGPG